jgi:cobalt/nickel transport system ATP-binding protein
MEDVMSGEDRVAGGRAGEHPESGERVAFVSCVSHTYEDGTFVSLCGLDFEAFRGTRVAVLGANGSGKTTLLFHLLGLLRPTEGQVRVFGRDPATEWSEIRRRIGVVLQNVEEQLLAPTVADDVGFSPRQYGLAEDEVSARVARALGVLEIEQLADRVPHNLSGGEKRKVALAGALVMEPDLLVLDEPFEGLDPESRADLIGLLNGLARERQTTVIMATHDIDSVQEFADFAYVLAPGGNLVLRGTPTEVFTHADVLDRGNIRPPILAQLFEELRREDQTAPEAATTPQDAARKLLGWKHGKSCEASPGSE